MSRVMHSPPGTDTEPVEEATAPRSVWRAFLVGAVLILLVVGGLLWAIRTFVFPTFEANSEANRQVATAQAQLATLQTQQAVTPRPAPTVAAAAAGQPTPVATPTPTTAPAPQPAATAAPTAAPTAAATAAPAPGAPGSAATPLPTVPPALEAEVAQAYRHYFDVTSEALLNLDPSHLPEVAAGPPLAGLEQDIERDRAEHRALQTNVHHDFVVLQVEGDQAIVADQYRDGSIYVDPDTHAPLPGQVAPASPDEAPIVRVVYYLQKIDGVWKVVRGERET